MSSIVRQVTGFVGPAVVASLIAVSLSCAADNHAKPNFRDVRWFDHMDTVKKLERAKFLEYRDHEMNVAVDPPKPWKTEHLYYEDTLLGRRVRVLYRFDNDCRLLYRADYIFDSVLTDGDISVLTKAIQDKYGVELSANVINNEMFVHGSLDEETTVNINQRGLLHHWQNNTVVYYQTKKFHWLGGWAKGAEPSCKQKSDALKAIQEKL